MGSSGNDSTPPVVCVLAGGRGTRLGHLVETAPKPIIEVAGEPFLIHQLRLLSSCGIRKVVLCVGHLRHQIELTVGRRWGDLDIDYSYDSPALDGTLGAVRNAAPLLGRRFLVMYGDTYLRVDYRGFYCSWLASQLPAGMVVLRNDNRWDHSNAIFADGLVTLYDKFGKTPEMRWIDYGLGALTCEALGRIDPSERDLSTLYHELSVRRELFGYEATQRFYEIGTPEALAETDDFLSKDRSD